MFYRFANDFPGRLPGEAVEPDLLRAAGHWPAAAAYTAGTISLTLGITAGVVLPLLTGTLLR